MTTANILKLGKNPSTWQEWVAEWNRDDLNPYERTGLLHHAFNILMPQDQQGFGSRIDRVSFFLMLANRASRSPDYLENGGKEIVSKARSILVNKILARESGEAVIIFSSPEASKILLPLLADFLCTRDGTGYGNWVYRKKNDTDVEEARLSSYFMAILGSVLDPKASFSDSDTVEAVLRIRQRVISTAFLEAPSEFYSTIRHRLYQNSDDCGFGEKDFRVLLNDLQGKSSGDMDIPTLIQSDVVHREVAQGISRCIGLRTIMTPIRHWEVIILIGTLIEERKAAMAKRTRL